MAGCKGKINETLIAKAADLIRAGNYAVTAATCCGISQDSWYNWLALARKIQEEGREARTDYERLCVVFFDAITCAEAEAEANLLSKIRLHDMTDFRAPLEVLRRRFPARWAPTAPRPVEKVDDAPGLLKRLFTNIRESLGQKVAPEEGDG
jgi:hypothetical protein